MVAGLNTARDALTRHNASPPEGDTFPSTFPQVVTHVTRVPDIAHNSRVTRVTRTPRFDPPRGRAREVNQRNPEMRHTRHPEAGR